MEGTIGTSVKISESLVVKLAFRETISSSVRGMLELAALERSLMERLKGGCLLQVMPVHSDNEQLYLRE